MVPALSLRKNGIAEGQRWPMWGEKAPLDSVVGAISGLPLQAGVVAPYRVCVFRTLVYGVCF